MCRLARSDRRFQLVSFSSVSAGVCMHIGCCEKILKWLTFELAMIWSRCRASGDVVARGVAVAGRQRGDTATVLVARRDRRRVDGCTLRHARPAAGLPPCFPCQLLGGEQSTKHVWGRYQACKAPARSHCCPGPLMPNLHLTPLISYSADLFPLCPSAFPSLSLSLSLPGQTKQQTPLPPCCATVRPKHIAPGPGFGSPPRPSGRSRPLCPPTVTTRAMQTPSAGRKPGIPGAPTSPADAQRTSAADYLGLSA